MIQGCDPTYSFAIEYNSFQYAPLIIILLASHPWQPFVRFHISNGNDEYYHGQTNLELECPLFHAKMKTIYEWSKIVPSCQRGVEAAN